jgi:hypothetical protein
MNRTVKVLINGKVVKRRAIVKDELDNHWLFRKLMAVSINTNHLLALKYESERLKLGSNPFVVVRLHNTSPSIVLLASYDRLIACVRNEVTEKKAYLSLDDWYVATEVEPLVFKSRERFGALYTIARAPSIGSSDRIILSPKKLPPLNE